MDDEVLENRHLLIKAYDALKQIEWGAGQSPDIAMCPLCDQVQANGHSPDCHVGSVLAEIGEYI